MMKRRIEVVAYNSQWPAHFKAEAASLACVFKHCLVGLHHIGSTAVPGLAAKPTIDILIEVKVGTSVSDYYEAMRQLGYECRGECLDAVIPGTPGRYFFPKVVNAQHVLHVHACHEGHSQIVELLSLRDYLRTHANEVESYGKHKAGLAAQFPYNNTAYMCGKDAMVKELTAKAMRWKAQHVIEPERGQRSVRK
jgi:GrpB-like predicted nucleotidyltransferase (UPF0157 family)